jgi:hypothetical protein
MTKERVKQIIDTDITKLSKLELNELRNELNKAISWWRVTPTHELRVIGLYGMFQSMIDKSNEMLKTLKQ